MVPLMQFVVKVLQLPPSVEWWAGELERLLGLFEARLTLPGYARSEVRDHVSRARTEDPLGFDLDALAFQLRGLFETAADPAVHEDLALLDIVLARLGNPGAIGRLGTMVSLSLAIAPRGSLDEPATMLELNREVCSLTGCGKESITRHFAAF